MTERAETFAEKMAHVTRAAREAQMKQAEKDAGFDLKKVLNAIEGAARSGKDELRVTLKQIEEEWDDEERKVEMYRFLNLREAILDEKLQAHGFKTVVERKKDTSGLWDLVIKW